MSRSMATIASCAWVFPVIVTYPRGRNHIYRQAWPPILQTGINRYSHTVQIPAISGSVSVGLGPAGTRHTSYAHVCVLWGRHPQLCRPSVRDGRHRDREETITTPATVTPTCPRGRAANELTSVDICSPVGHRIPWFTGRPWRHQTRPVRGKIGGVNASCPRGSLAPSVNPAAGYYSWSDMASMPGAQPGQFELFGEWTSGRQSPHSSIGLWVWWVWRPPPRKPE